VLLLVLSVDQNHLVLLVVLDQSLDVLERLHTRTHTQVINTTDIVIHEINSNVYDRV